MSQRAPNILKQWAVFGGLLVALHAGFAVIWIVLEPALMRTPALVIVLTLVYLPLFAVIMIVFYRRINRATEPPEYIEAREQGTPAPAKVLSIERTRWRIERYRNLRFQVRPTRFEYVIRVRVRPEGGPEYEAELAAYLSGADTPYKGDTIQVKIHPQRPDVLVFDKRYSDKIGGRGARRP